MRNTKIYLFILLVSLAASCKKDDDLGDVESIPGLGGDTWTPTWINLFGFWMFQIPLAYLMAKGLELGPLGVFIAIPVAETAITIAAWLLFRRGKWKTVKI